MSIDTNKSNQTETNSEIEFDIPEMNNNTDTSKSQQSEGYTAKEETETPETTETEAPSDNEEDGIGFNLYAMTGGLFGAVAGAIRTKSIAGACAGVVGAVTASHLTSGGERSPVKHFSIGLATGLATSAVVSESLNYFNTPSDTLEDSDDAIVMTTEESKDDE